MTTSEPIHKSWPKLIEGRFTWHIRCGAYPKKRYANHKTQWRFVTCEKCLVMKIDKTKKYIIP
jgi:hypothetical protein